MQIQALDPTQPLLPTRPGQIERCTRYYTRHGITSLFAALDVATGVVIGHCYSKHRSSEFRGQIEANLLIDLDIHLAMDDRAARPSRSATGW